MQDQLQTSLAHSQKLEQAAIDECDGSGGTGKIGIGPVCRLKRERAAGAKDDHVKLITELSPLLAQLKAQIASIHGDVEVQKAASRDAKRLSDGLVARLEALYRLTGNNIAIRFLSYGIVALLALVEIIPIILKIISGPTSFDAFRQEVLVRSRIVQSELSNRERIDQRSITEKIAVANAADIAIYRQQLEGDIVAHRATLKALPSTNALPSSGEIVESNKSQKRDEVFEADMGKQAQNLLSTLGYYNGSIDGVIGDATRNAIKEFQKSIGVSVTGELTIQLLDNLKLTAKMEL